MTARRILSVDVGQRNLGMAIWEVTKACAKNKRPAKINLAYLACHDVLASVGCVAKCSNVTKVDSVRHLCTFLGRHQDAWDVTSVTDFVVEGQVRASPKNLSLTAALFAWFTLCHATTPGERSPHMATICAKNKFKGPLDLSDTESPTPQSSTSKAKGKGKTAKGVGGNPKGVASKTKGVAYRQRKKDAVSSFQEALVCQLFTYTSSDVLAQWKSAKKKDDMADAALQGLWYIENKLKIKVE